MNDINYFLLVSLLVMIVIAFISVLTVIEYWKLYLEYKKKYQHEVGITEMNYYSNVRLLSVIDELKNDNKALKDFIGEKNLPTSKPH